MSSRESQRYVWAHVEGLGRVGMRWGGLDWVQTILPRIGTGDRNGTSRRDSKGGVCGPDPHASTSWHL